MNRKPLSDSEIEQKILNLNGWRYVDNKLKKSFIFNNFIEAFGFMSKVALKAEKMDHHPEWFNVYNRVEVDLATHDPQGISDLDFCLASFMDKIGESNELNT